MKTPKEKLTLNENNEGTKKNEIKGYDVSITMKETKIMIVRQLLIPTIIMMMIVVSIYKQ
jgi:hypothetical protein